MVEQKQKVLSSNRLSCWTNCKDVKKPWVRNNLIWSKYFIKCHWFPKSFKIAPPKSTLSIGKNKLWKIIAVQQIDLAARCQDFHRDENLNNKVKSIWHLFFKVIFPILTRFNNSLNNLKSKYFHFSSTRTTAACRWATSTPWTGSTPTRCTTSGWPPSPGGVRGPPRPPSPRGRSSTVSPLSKTATYL